MRVKRSYSFRILSQNCKYSQENMKQKNKQHMNTL